MTNCTEDNNIGASSSTTPTEVSQDIPVFDIRMMNEVDDHSISVDEKEDTSVLNQVDPDEVNLLIVKCDACGSDIEVSIGRDRSVDFDAYNTICPACNKGLGEDAIRMVQNSIFQISQKGIWNPRRNGVSHVHWELHDKKDASWEPNKHEPVPDSISPASRDNVYLPSLNDMLSDEEDTISNASDVVIAEDTSIPKRIGTDAMDTSDELDVQERSNRADFSQELLMSTLSLE